MTLWMICRRVVDDITVGFKTTALDPFLLILEYFHSSYRIKNEIGPLRNTEFSEIKFYRFVDEPVIASINFSNNEPIIMI
jgi:hypothetical protein